MSTTGPKIDNNRLEQRWLRLRPQREVACTVDNDPNEHLVAPGITAAKAFARRATRDGKVSSRNRAIALLMIASFVAALALNFFRSL